MGQKKSRRQRQKPEKHSHPLPDPIAELLSLPTPSGSKASEEEERGKSVLCFLCGRKLEVRSSKKGRPYFICDDCGLQVFVRGDKGISRLAEIVLKNSE